MGQQRGSIVCEAVRARWTSRSSEDLYIVVENISGYLKHPLLKSPQFHGSTICECSPQWWWPVAGAMHVAWRQTAIGKEDGLPVAQVSK